MNRSVVLIPLAFVLGGLVGYWGPSEDVRELKARAEAAPEKPAAASGFGSFAQIVRIPEAANPHRMRRRQAEREAAEAAKAKPETNGVATADTEDAQDAVRRPPISPEDLRARIDEAAAFWRTRADMARAKAIEKLGLDEAGAARFDEALAAMNDRLRDSLQTIADMLENQESMTPEIGVRLMGDLATTVAEAYAGVGTCVDESRRGEVSSLQLIDFVDPSVAEPLIAVQGKLEGAPFLPSGRGRR